MPDQPADQPRPTQDERSELDAAEAVSPSSFSSDDPKPGEIMCPNCGHPVEAGFKFCDWCGRPLPADAAPKPVTPPPPPVVKPPAPEPKPAVEPPVAKQPPEPKPVPAPTTPPPVQVKPPEPKPEPPPAPLQPGAALARAATK